MQVSKAHFYNLEITAPNLDNIMPTAVCNKVLLLNSNKPCKVQVKGVLKEKEGGGRWKEQL